MKQQRFSNKVMVVTGAAQGIGYTVAKMASDQGAIVVLVDRSDLVNELRDELLESDRAALSIIADLEQYSQCCQFVDTVLAEYGRIDILVNNVGGTMWMKPYEKYDENEIEAEIRRSLFPTLWCCHAVLPVMQAQQSGAIVNVSSIATKGLHRVPYGAAKGGVNAITACLAFENADKGIRVNGAAAGGTEAGERRIPRNTTPLSEQEKTYQKEVIEQTYTSSLMSRYGSTQEQANAILFLASDEASYITGVTVPVAGGDLG